jgi:hypothetical protein
MLERSYQAHLIKKINRLFPECIVQKQDPSYRQGFPDLLILFPYSFWVALEVKAFATAHRQPNQPYFVDLLNSMSFAAFIHPDNEEEVLDAVQRAYEVHRDTCLSQCE